MQVTARVLPGRPSWTAVDETRAFLATLAPAPWTGTAVRRPGLVLIEAEVQRADDRREVVVTLQHPLN